MPVNEFKLPDVGEGLIEAEIVTWNVAAGDTIKVNDVICEIETAKSLVELPSPYAGTVAELLVPEGATVAVGTPIIAVSTGTGAGAPEPAAAGGSSRPEAPAEDDAPQPTDDAPVEPGVVGSPAPKADRTPTLVGYGPRTVEAKRRPRKTPSPAGGPPSRDASRLTARQGVQASFAPHMTPPPEADVTDVPQTEVSAVSVARSPGAHGAAAGGTTVGAKTLAKPPVRKLARDLGVDLAAVAATGPDGTVIRTDVERHAAGSGTAPAVETAPRRPGAHETRLPVKGVRRMTAQAMVSSAFTAPHVTEWVTIDATRTVRMVSRLRDRREFRELKVSPLLLVARAVCAAIRRTPEVNATWDEHAQEIVLKHYVNLGIAAATPRGLVVPNVKGADEMSAVELASALGALTATARAGRTQPSEMSGGSFTITNVGVFGVDSGTPIINPGESAILCMGAIRRQPWVVGKKVKPRWVTTLALSFDHRIVDGEQGSRFLADVAGIVADPGSALLL